MDLEHERRLTAVEDRAKSNQRRLDEMEKRQDNLDSLVSSVAVMASEQEHIKEDVGEIKTTVNTMAERPAKRWENIVTQIVSILVASVMGFLLAKMGLSA